MKKKKTKLSAQAKPPVRAKTIVSRKSKKSKKVKSKNEKKFEAFLKKLEFFQYKSTKVKESKLKVFAGGGDGFDRLNDPYGGD